LEDEEEVVVAQERPYDRRQPPQILVDEEDHGVQMQAYVDEAEPEYVAGAEIE